MLCRQPGRRITFEIYQQGGAPKSAQPKTSRGRVYSAVSAFSRLRHPRSHHKATITCHKPLGFKGLVAGTTGLEPATSAVTGQRSNQLSYVPNSASRHKPPPDACSLPPHSSSEASLRAVQDQNAVHPKSTRRKRHVDSKLSPSPLAASPERCTACISPLSRTSVRLQPRRPCPKLNLACTQRAVSSVG